MENTTKFEILFTFGKFVKRRSIKAGRRGMGIGGGMNKTPRLPSIRAIITNEQKRREKYAKLGRMNDWRYVDSKRGYLNGLIDGAKYSIQISHNHFQLEYHKIRKHRENCKKWGKKFCLDCFGKGLTEFARKISIEEEARL